MISKMTFFVQTNECEVCIIVGSFESVLHLDSDNGTAYDAYIYTNVHINVLNKCESGRAHHSDSCAGTRTFKLQRVLVSFLLTPITKVVYCLGGYDSDEEHDSYRNCSRG